MKHPDLWTARTVLTFALFSAVTLSAKLEFEATHLVLEAPPGASQMDAVFPFTNTGDKTVRILRARASCGCTAATLEKKVYEPGESGQIETIFTIGSRVGHQHKTVTVDLDDGEMHSVTLSFETEIARMIQVDPRLLLWRRSDYSGQDVAAFETKAIRVEFPSREMTIAEVRTLNGEGFSYEIKEIEAGKVYELHLTPEAMDRPRRAIYQIVADFPEENPTTYTVFAYIR